MGHISLLTHHLYLAVWRIVIMDFVYLSIIYLPQQLKHHKTIKLSITLENCFSELLMDICSKLLDYSSLGISTKLSKFPLIHCFRFDYVVEVSSQRSHPFLVDTLDVRLHVLCREYTLLADKPKTVVVAKNILTYF